MQAFFEHLKPVFGGTLSHAQKEGVRLLLAASEGQKLRHRAYILATAAHETGNTMQPVREAFGVSDDDTINRLERAWAKGQLRWVPKPYWRKDKSGKAWFGRGFVQLTFKENYKRAGDKLGVNLLEDPSRALNPDLAARILVRGMAEGWFTGRKLSDFPDYNNMRRVVNGMDRAEHIANIARFFEAALKELGSTKNPAAHKTRNPLADLFQAIAAIFKAIFGGKA